MKVLLLLALSSFLIGSVLAQSLPDCYSEGECLLSPLVHDWDDVGLQVSLLLAVHYEKVQNL